MQFLGLFAAGAVYVHVHTHLCQLSPSLRYSIHKDLHLQAVGPNATNATSSCQQYNYTEENGTQPMEMYPPRICHAKSTGVSDFHDWPSACALQFKYVHTTNEAAVVVEGGGSAYGFRTLWSYLRIIWKLTTTLRLRLRLVWRGCGLHWSL